MIAVERRDLAMVIGDFGRYANRSNLISQSGRFLIPQKQAAYILDEMTATVANSWYATCKDVGVTERDCELIRSAFVYKGLGYDLYDTLIQSGNGGETPFRP